MPNSLFADDGVYVQYKEEDLWRVVRQGHDLWS